MKNSLVLFLLLIIVIHTCFSRVTKSVSRRRKNLKSSRVNTKLVSKLKTRHDIKNNIYAWLNSEEISVRKIGNVDKGWICTTQGGKAVFYIYEISSVTIYGDAPAKCGGMATTSTGDLYVASDNKLYFLTKNVDISFSWTIITSVNNPVDVSVSSLDDVYVITSSGEIYRLFGTKKMEKFNNNKNIGSGNFRFDAVTFGTTMGFFVLKSDLSIVLIKGDNTISEVTELKARDFCVDPLTNELYILTAGGVYLLQVYKYGLKNNSLLVSSNQFKKVSCASNLWLIGMDGFIYTSNKVFSH